MLDDVSLNVPKGQMLCLLGPSGAGKTTMVNLVVGALVPDRGTVSVMGEQAPYTHVRSRIGFIIVFFVLATMGFRKKHAHRGAVPAVRAA